MGRFISIPDGIHAVSQSFSLFLLANNQRARLAASDALLVWILTNNRIGATLNGHFPGPTVLKQTLGPNTESLWDDLWGSRS
jgi:hypothetical protein